MAADIFPSILQKTWLVTSWASLRRPELFEDMLPGKEERAGDRLRLGEMPGSRERHNLCLGGLVSGRCVIGEGKDGV